MKKIIVIMSFLSVSLNGQWVSLSHLGTARFGASALVAGGKILVMGGYTHSHHRVTPTASVEILDSLGGTWRRGIDLPEPLAFFGTAVFRRRLFVFGGIGPNERFSDRIYMFDPDSGRWFHVGDMPVPLAAFALTEIDSSFYFLGGMTEDNFYNSLVLKFTPQTHSWDTITVTSWVPRSYMAYAVLNDTAYLMGGFYFGQVNWMTLFDGYEIVGMLNTPSEIMGAVAVDYSNNHIYLLGGISGGATTSECQDFDVENRRWNPLPSLPEPRAFASAVVYDDHIVFIGGKFRRHAQESVYALPLSSIEEDVHEPQLRDIIVTTGTILRPNETISVMAKSKGELRIYSLSGRLVREYHLETGINRIVWNAMDLPSGVYIYRFRKTTGKWLYLR